MASAAILYDLTIIGAGPIGVLMALLAYYRAKRLGAHCRIAVMDKAPIALLNEPMRDGRTFALTPQTIDLLKELSLWEALAPQGCPIEHILITEGKAQEGTHYDDRLRHGPYGYIIESADLRQGLMDRLLETKDIHFFPNCALEGVFPGLFSHRLIFQDGTQHNTRLVVGADGRNSVVRDYFGMEARTFLYEQHALVCHFSHEYPHRGWAMESFFPTGPFATLPMLGTQKHPHLSGMVWSDAPETITRLKSISEKAFNEVLATKLETHRYGNARCVSHRWTYPLMGLVTPQMVSLRVALVGDAAHVIHPVAGQGLNLGIKDIDTLSVMVGYGLSLGLDPGLGEILTRYQRLRRLDVVGYLGITHGILELFKIKSAVMSSLRHEGLKALDKLSFLKKAIMDKGMGKQSDYGLSLERQALRDADLKQDSMEDF